MTHASLFSGIGGFDLAAEWMGWKNLFHCENNPFAQQILKYYWPKSKSYEDIKKTNFTSHRGQIDVLTGGFPCQPFSVAGQREGDEDDRYLWPEMCRVIDECRPVWVIGENVAGITSMVQSTPFKTRVESQNNLFGENNEEIETEYSEFILHTIVNDLERRGFEVQPIIIPACAVGAPHRRDRIWIIGYSDRNAKFRNLCKKHRRTISHTKYNGLLAAKDGRSDGQSSIATWSNAVGKSKRANSLWTSNVADCANARSKSMRKQKVQVFRSDATADTKITRRRYISGHASCKGRKDKKISFVAHISSDRIDVHTNNKRREQFNVSTVPNRTKFSDRGHHAELDAYTDRIRLRRTLNWDRKTEFFDKNGEKPDWRNFPTQSPVCGGDDGISYLLDDLSIPKLKWLRESIKGFGNAIVPEIAFEIFLEIKKQSNVERYS